MKKNLYEILGVDLPGNNQEVTPDEIKAGYRKRCRETHPDKGGNVEDFREAQRAYDILSDPEKRASYNKNGDYEFVASKLERAEDEIISIAEKLIDLLPMDQDLIQSLRSKITESILDFEVKTLQAQSELTRVRRLRARIVYRPSESTRDLLTGVFEKREIALNRLIKGLRKSIEVAQEALVYCGAFRDTGQPPALTEWSGMELEPDYAKMDAGTAWQEDKNPECPICGGEHYASDCIE